jgi:hypothetical protein
MCAEGLHIVHMRYAVAYADFNAVIYMRFCMTNLYKFISKHEIYQINTYIGCKDVRSPVVKYFGASANASVRITLPICAKFSSVLRLIFYESSMNANMRPHKQIPCGFRAHTHMLTHRPHFNSLVLPLPPMI